ncbi:MAG: hypothetical protein ACI4Q4_02860 [Oscillospiraceae bacterium]
MNTTRTAKALLNASLIVHGAYALLFLAGYFFQKAIWRIFGAWEEIEQKAPIISPAIVIVLLGTFALSAWLNISLRKKADGMLPAVFGALAAVFAVCAFIADRLTKAISCVYYSVVVGRVNGAEAVYLAGLHENSIQFLDTFLLILLAAGLALLPCAYCVLRCGEKENNFSKG